MNKPASLWSRAPSLPTQAPHNNKPAEYNKTKTAILYIWGAKHYKKETRERKKKTSLAASLHGRPDSGKIKKKGKQQEQKKKEREKRKKKMKKKKKKK